MAGRLDRLARLYAQPDAVTSDEWRSVQRVFATINRLLADNAPAQAAFYTVLNEEGMRPDDPPRHISDGYLDVFFLGALRTALEPHCDLIALAEALMENKAESEE